jgi:hypothetical protein
MIKFKDLTPDVYYNESRDFQLLGRLFDVVLNSVKTEADLLYNIPVSDNSNDKLLELLTLTLGFKAAHQYNTKQLRSICKVFPEILRSKGSIKSIITACNALFNAAGEEQALDYNFTPGTDNAELNLYVPQSFGDITALNDLLTYVLPAGMSCNIIRELRLNVDSKTEIQTMDTFTLYSEGDNAVYGAINDAAFLYNENKLARIPQLSNSTATDKTSGILNTVDAVRGIIKDNPGFIMNTGIYKAPLEEPGIIRTTVGNLTINIPILDKARIYEIEGT